MSTPFDFICSSKLFSLKDPSLHLEGYKLFQCLSRDCFPSCLGLPVDLFLHTALNVLVTWLL